MIASRRWVWVSALAAWAAFALFNRLGAAPVYVTNEAREGVYVQAMLRSGDFIAPQIPNHVENGEVVPDKPPLFHWLAAAATWARARVGGSGLAAGAGLADAFDEWDLRFPSALCACLMVVAIATLGSALVGERAALLAAAALLTTAQFNYQARLGRVDVVLACFVTLALLIAARALVAGRTRWLPAAGVASGLAVLAKGPLGVVLPGLVCAAFCWLRPRGEVVRALPWRATAVLLLAVAAPWYVAASAASGGAVVRSQLFAENLDQFFGGNGRMRAFFYAWPWFVDSLPWNLAALAGLIEAWRRRESGPTFCAVWWITLLVFFQAAAYKRRAYLLPALPAEALLAGWWLDRRLSSASGWCEGVGGRARRIVRMASACAPGAAVGALLASAIVPLWLADRLSTFDGTATLAGAAIIGSAALLGYRRIRDDSWRDAVVPAWLSLAAAYALLVPTALELLARSLSTKRFVEQVEGALSEHQALTVCGMGADSTLVVLFYFRDAERIRVLPDGPCPTRPAAGFYLVPSDEWPRLRRNAAVDEWREVFSAQRKGWTTRDDVVLVERVE